ncbi:GumC family protein [Azospirillum sp. ST 5-10]|uniref:GumC family protein n=1 Tax=unclassified Azospirillum TaxID=2630922 RepID=UPI003F4A4BE6
MPVNDGAPELSFSELLSTLWRRRFAIAGAALLLAVAGFAVAKALPPSYTAVGRLAIEPERQRVTNIEALLTDVTTTAEYMESEAQILLSRDFAWRVIQTLDLAHNPAFLPPAPDEMGLVDQAKAAVTEAAIGLAEGSGLLGPGEARAMLDPPAVSDPQADRETLIDAFLAGLRVDIVGKSWVFEVAYASPDPKLSHDVVNAVLAGYLDRKAGDFSSFASKAGDYLEDKSAQLQREVFAAEQRVEEFRSNSALAANQSAASLQSQIDNFSTRVATLSSEINAAQAHYDAVERAVEEHGSTAALDGVDNDLISELGLRLADLMAQRAETREKLGPAHPRLVGIESQVAEVQARLRNEGQILMRKLARDIGSLSEERESLQRTMMASRTRLADLMQAEVRLRALERQAGATRSVYESFLHRAKEVENDYAPVNADVVSSASYPVKPSFPRPLMFAALGFVMGGAGASAMAVMRLALLRGFRNVEEIERALDLPVLATIPKLPGDPLHVPHHPTRSFVHRRALMMEGYNQVAKALDLSPHRTEGARTILVTSAVSGEGKSTTSLALASLYALANRRVCVVDFDLRNPSITHRLQLRDYEGVGDVFADGAPLDVALTTTEESNVTVLPAGRPVDPHGVVTNERVRTLLGELGQRFDVVIVDAPPVLAAPDALVLGAHAMQTVLVMKPASPKSEVRDTVGRLAKMGAAIDGVVLCQVPMRTAGDFGAYSIKYASKQFHKYYAPRPDLIGRG